MTTIPDATPDLYRPRFGLGDLLHFVTLTSVLLALTPIIGMAGALGLWMVALALAARQGLLAVLALTVSVVLAGGTDGSPGAMPDFLQQFAVVGLAMLLCFTCRASATWDIVRRCSEFIGYERQWW